MILAVGKMADCSLLLSTGYKKVGFDRMTFCLQACIDLLRRQREMSGGYWKRMIGFWPIRLLVRKCLTILDIAQFLRGSDNAIEVD